MSQQNSSGGLSPADLRVLLVEDQDDLLMMMNLMLKKRSEFTIEIASSGAQAMEKAHHFAPHVVISDIGMPEMDGCELMENLRRLEGEKISPFKAIALSGYDIAQEDRVLASGYDAHLTKPVDFDQLLGLISKMGLDVGERLRAQS